VAEPNVPGKPTKGTWIKVFLVVLFLALIFTWMTCASHGLPFATALLTVTPPTGLLG
jgi:hypothetical protein